MMNSITRRLDIRDCQAGNIAGNDDNIAKLPLRPIISNIDTALYYLSIYLAKFL